MWTDVSPRKIYKWATNIEKMLSSISYQRFASQSMARYHLTPARMTRVKKT